MAQNYGGDKLFYISCNRSFDESTWGAFDTQDDTDSVWGFNPASTKVSLIYPSQNIRSHL